MNFWILLSYFYFAIKERQLPETLFASTATITATEVQEPWTTKWNTHHALKMIGLCLVAILAVSYRRLGILLSLTDVYPKIYCIFTLRFLSKRDKNEHDIKEKNQEMSHYLGVIWKHIKKYEKREYKEPDWYIFLWLSEF